MNKEFEPGTVLKVCDAVYWSDDIQAGGLGSDADLGLVVSVIRIEETFKYKVLWAHYSRRAEKYNYAFSEHTLDELAPSTYDLEQNKTR